MASNILGDFGYGQHYLSAPYLCSCRTIQPLEEVALRWRSLRYIRLIFTKDEILNTNDDLC